MPNLMSLGFIGKGWLTKRRPFFLIRFIRIFDDSSFGVGRRLLPIAEDGDGAEPPPYTENDRRS